MKFSYVLGEAEYVEAMKMATRLGLSARIVAFAVILLVTVMLIQLTVVPVWIVSLANPAGPGEWALLSWSLIWRVAVHCAIPGLIAMAAFWYWRRVSLTNQLRRRYRANPNFRGTMTVAIEADRLIVESSHPSRTEESWNCIRRGREAKRVLLLSHPWGTMHMINISGLSEAEREELRGILRASVPGKK